MFVIADKRIPAKVLTKLAEIAEILPFSSEGITYEEISGHPDIFFCQVDNQLVAAPNTPSVFLDLLNEKNIPFQTGNLPVGNTKHNAIHYNAVVTSSFLIHNTTYTDLKIKELSANKTPIICKQGYTRCSLIAPDDSLLITSDAGIAKTLSRKQVSHFYIPTKEVLLPGFEYGFIGGCCGYHQKQLFFMGSLDRLSNGMKLKEYILSRGYSVIELFDGPLFDGGSLLFIPKPEQNKKS